MPGLEFHQFGSPTDPLVRLGGSTQVDYVRCYLDDLGAEAVLEEPSYFDRDYLSEFAAFYSTSARGYPNRCRRLHFFSERLARSRFMRAVGESSAEVLDCSRERACACGRGLAP